MQEFCKQPCKQIFVILANVSIYASPFIRKWDNEINFSHSLVPVTQFYQKSFANYKVPLPLLQKVERGIQITSK